MPRSSLFLSIFLGSLLVPLSVLGAPVPTTGLNAALQTDGSIVVSWKQDPNPDITAYRIYYSHQSILNNSGYYDDFEMTDSPVGTYTLKDFPPDYPMIFITVTPVYTNKDEAAFVEEAKVVLKSPLDLLSSSSSAVAAPPAKTAETPSSSSSSAPLPPPPPQVTPPALPPPVASSSSVAPVTPSSPSSSSSSVQSEPATLRLLSATALSPTQVFLEFSAPLLNGSGEVLAALSIKNSSGTVLPLEQLTMSGRTLIVRTAQQTANMVYDIRLADSIRGVGGLLLDPVDRSAFFTGNRKGTGSSASSKQTAVLPPLPGSGVPDVLKFSLDAVPQKDGRTCTVTGRWELDSRTPQSAFIVVRQSRDNGQTFGPPEVLTSDMQGVQIPNVTLGSFGVAVYVVDAQGHSSPGIFRSVLSWDTPQTTLPAVSSTPQMPTPPVARVTPPSPPRGKALSQSGVGEGMGIVLIGVIGALLGWRYTRSRFASAA